MEVKFRFGEDYSMENVVFEGLSGLEYVTSTKDALNVMKIRNPAVDFAGDVKAGRYDALSDKEYRQALETVRSVRDLWHYPDDPEGSQSRHEMNVLTLLANAMELISRQDVLLRKYGEHIESD